MVHVSTVEMIEHSAHNDPTIVSETAWRNGSFVCLSNGKAVAPTADGELWVVINTLFGDKRYLEREPDSNNQITLLRGERLNCYRVKDWDGKELIVTGSTIDGQVDQMSVGTVLKAMAGGGLGTNGINTTVTFTIVEKIAYLGEPAFRVKIAVAA